MQREALMTHSAVWWAETAQFFAYLHGRGWQYTLLRFGQHLVSMHDARRRTASNDNEECS